MYKPTLNFITELKSLTQHKDRYVKGNSMQLLKRLQELNPQDEEWTCLCGYKIPQDNKPIICPCCKTQIG